MIDITMTAALRKEILEQTLISILNFVKYDGDFRLIIDVAPVGDMNQTQNEVLDIAEEYFDNVKSRMVNPSLQADAVKWTWQQSNTQYVLQWEDDWVAVKEINLNKVIRFIERSDLINLGAISFDRIEKPVKTYPAYQGSYRIYDPNFYIRTKGKSLGGPPSLMCKWYLKRAINFINPKECLDITTHNSDVQDFLSEWVHGWYLGEDGEGKQVKDIGKAWLKSKGMKRNKRSSVGVLWE